MRLFLHGRLTPAMLRTKLEQAPKLPITFLLLSSWDFDNIDGEITQLLIQYLQSRQPHELEEVSLHNCKGDQQEIVSATVNASPRCFTVRYDKQQTELPTSVATGLIQGSRGSRLERFQLRGVTLTASVVESFRLALPQIQSFHSLSINSHFTLVELDRKHVSILGRKCQDMDDVIYEVIRLVQELRSITCLDLENCHIPDSYLAELVRAVNKSHLSTLKLRGNMAQQETMSVLCEWMISKDCPLKHLDLSWQRSLESGKSNCSPFVTQMPFLAKIILHNTSLKTLLISENRIQDADMKILCMALVQNKTLEDLDLKDCRISMGGFRRLAKSLHKFQLLRLNLNGIQQVEGSKLKSLFFAPLSQNVYLLDLVLPSVESKSLAWLLEWNKAGRRVLVSKTELPPALWPLLLERADQVGQRASDREPTRHSASAIYYLLREKGFGTVAKHHQQTSLAPKRTLPLEGITTPPSTPRRDDNSTSRISPDSSVEDDSRVGAVTPEHPTIRHIHRTSGEIELRLEESSSFDKGEAIKPSPFLLRPRLVATRKSSSVSLEDPLSCTGMDRGSYSRKPLAAINKKAVQ
jgi:hypothetical protein